MTMLFCWYGSYYMYYDNTNLMFYMINVFVHTVMYFYYYQTTFRLKPTYGIYITYMQVIQMIVCIIIQYIVITNCLRNKIAISLGLFMYGIYTTLFAKLLYTKIKISKIHTN